MTWLFAAWRWIASSRAGQLAGVALGALVGVLLYGRSKRAQGRSEAQERMKDHDRQNADDIRRRARDADGLHPDEDERGYRD